MVQQNSITDSVRLGGVVLSVISSLFGVMLWLALGWSQPLLLGLAIVGLVGGFTASVRGSRSARWPDWGQVAQRRRVALRGFLAPIPQDADGPSEPALLFPPTIWLVPRWSFLLPSFGVWTLACWMFIAGLYSLTFSEHTVPALVLLLVPSLAISCLFCALLVWGGYQGIEVSPLGLTVWMPGKKKQTILWDEIRLFAIAPGRKASDPPVYYEISSMTTRLRFIRLRRGLPPWNHSAQLGFEAYDRQMEAMLAHIAAKTSLTLVDLR